MNIAYLFYKDGAISLPMYGYDDNLFRAVAGSRCARFDSSSRTFYIEDTEAGRAAVENAAGTRVRVMVDEEAGRVRVRGFFSQGWKTAGVGCPAPIVDSRVFFQREPAAKAEYFPPHWEGKFEAELRARKYSPRTQNAYRYFCRQLCQTLQKTPNEIDTCHVTQFIAALEKDRNYSASSLNLAISAVKFFYRHVLPNKDISEHYRPAHDKRLPVVLSKEEIGAILDMETNPKHRLLLTLVYSSGLRVSEVVALKREHIDLSRRVIYIRQGKGRKDRCTILSEKAAAQFERYISYNAVDTWLFPGQPPNRPLTIRSAQHIFTKATARARVAKKLSIHSLRHAFATHLLESGTDVRYIQTLLGHAHLRTTERYTHVARRSVLSIKSPLDTIP